MARVQPGFQPVSVIYFNNIVKKNNFVPWKLVGLIFECNKTIEKVWSVFCMWGMPSVSCILWLNDVIYKCKYGACLYKSSKFLKLSIYNCTYNAMRLSKYVDFFRYCIVFVLLSLVAMFSVNLSTEWVCT